MPYKRESYFFVKSTIFFLSLITRATPIRVSSHEHGWLGCPGLYRDQFRLGFVWEFSAYCSFRDEKRTKGDEFWSRAKFEKKANMVKLTQSYNFRSYQSFGNSYSCITAVKRDAYDVENTAGKERRCHPGRPVAEAKRRIKPAFIPITGLKCPYIKISRPLTKIPFGKTEI